MIALCLLPERNCATCTARQQKEWGCDARQRPDGTWTDRALVPMEVDGREDWACPRRPVKDDPALFGELMSLYGLYAEGVLADEGGVMSQTVKYLAIMRLIRGTVNECRAEQMEKTS